MDATIAPYPCTRPRRKSAIRDSLHPLDALNPLTAANLDSLPSAIRPQLKVRFRSTNSIVAHPDDSRPERESDWEDCDEETKSSGLGLRSKNGHDVYHTSQRHPLHTVVLLVVVLAVSMLLSYGPWASTSSRLASMSATANEIRSEASMSGRTDIFRRANSPTDACMRFSHQSALVNGTLYIYGGQTLTQGGQTDNTWTNNFITLDLTKTWQIGSPPFTGLPQPSGPPAVSNAYLWSSYDALYLYGGIFSWKPEKTPTTPSLWQYNIKSASWQEHTNLKAAGGANAVAAGTAINRAGEGAGASMASFGKGWYFGGHLDHYTTPGWSVQVARKYLTSLIEYTFPGYPTVDGTIAGADGEWRNITTGGIQAQAGFTPRADGLLVFVPGFGDQGVLVSIGGGVNETYTPMNEIDVFDIATSTWYKQATSGSYPSYRVNPCAVVAAAADGSSYNIHMWAGQDLQPFGNQLQHTDMWILSIPSFIWISVDQTGQSVPPGRSGATCNVWDGQMVVVGGYPGAALTCDSPGVYVFNLSSLAWQNSFVSLSGSSSKKRAIANNANPFSQQLSQIGDNATSGLQGSYGYKVPPAVYSVIGGSPTGGATITTPVAAATSGPLATGHAVTYTVTNADGSLTTSTSGASLQNGTNNSNNRQGPNIGAIVAGVIAGVLFIVALYLGFCAFVYRRQLQLYKDHIAMSQHKGRGGNGTEKIGDFTAPTGFQVIRNSYNDKASSWRRSDNAALTGSSNAPSSSGSHNKHGSYSGLLPGAAGADGFGYHSGYARPTSTEGGTSEEDDDLLSGLEPTFVGVMLHPRRSLRVINTPA